MRKPEDHQPAGKHEARDINVRAVVGFGVGLLAGLVLIFFGIRGFTGILSRHRQPIREPIDISTTPPGPRLQINEAHDAAEFRDRETALLNTYGWVDRTTGVVRIPVERAMDLLVERGLPAPPPGAIGKTPLQMRQEKALGKVSP